MIYLAAWIVSAAFLLWLAVLVMAWVIGTVGEWWDGLLPPKPPPPPQVDWIEERRKAFLQLMEIRAEAYRAKRRVYLGDDDGI
jgi:hypothetical protein